MARKKTTFEWTQDDPEGDEREFAERRDRRQMRADNRALDALALRLSGLTPGQRDQLPLGELLRTEVDVLAGLGRKTAHSRQLRRVQGLLREADVEAIEEALDGDRPGDIRARQLEVWRTRLIEGDDDDLQAFLDEHPTGDRQQLRALVRQARGQGDAASRAGKKLFQALKAAPPAQAAPTEEATPPAEPPTAEDTPSAG